MKDYFVEDVQMAPAPRGKHIFGTVTMNERGVVLVSGMSAQVFAMLKDNSMNPYEFMMSVITDKRYERIAA